MVSNHINMRQFLNWQYSSEPLQLHGDGWRLELECFSDLGQALTGIQCLFANLLSLENAALKGQFDDADTAVMCPQNSNGDDATT